MKVYQVTTIEHYAYSNETQQSMFVSSIGKAHREFTLRALEQHGYGHTFNLPTRSELEKLMQTVGRAACFSRLSHGACTTLQVKLVHVY